jgi:hypothetical protein
VTSDQGLYFPNPTPRFPAHLNSSLLLLLPGRFPLFPRPSCRQYILCPCTEFLRSFVTYLTAAALESDGATGRKPGMHKHTGLFPSLPPTTRKRRDVGFKLYNPALLVGPTISTSIRRGVRWVFQLAFQPQAPLPAIYLSIFFFIHVFPVDFSTCCLLDVYVKGTTPGSVLTVLITGAHCIYYRLHLLHLI